jgi:OOP family OmpA-OmpF porin
MMRIKIGLGVLCVGLVALGLWARIVIVPEIETKIRSAAEAVVATSDHGLRVQVSGRDIDLLGLADSDAELAQMMQALQSVAGQRVVRKEGVQVLASARPYFFNVRKENGLTISGNVPSEAVRLRLGAVFGDQVNGLTLASGAPQDWEELITTGMNSLTPMVQGGFALEGAALILRGDVASPEDAKTIADGLAFVKTPIINGVRVLDDGAPAKYGLNYQRIGGTSLRGKLPNGLTVLAMQKALGVPKIKGDVKIATAGAVGEADYLTAWAGILDQLESLTSSVNGMDRKVLAKLIPGADAAKVKAALETGGFVVQITEQPKPVAEGDTRNNPDTGAPEVFNGGAWTMVEPVIAEPIIAAPTVVEPVVIEPPDAALCQVTTDAILAQTNVVFLPNSDQLDANGDGVVAELVKGMLPCATGALRAEIGGHTDTSGDPNQNLILSQLRADRVRAALISAGLPEVMLTAKGYGSAQPISENESAEGRAQNRRTAITWSQ